MTREDLVKYTTVGEVTRALKELIRKGESPDRDLGAAIFEILETTGDVSGYYQKDWDGVLRSLGGMAEDKNIEDLKREWEEKNAAAQIQEVEEEIATSKVPTEKIKELLEEYEALIREGGLKEEEAARRVEEREKGRIAKERIGQWIRAQQEYQRKALEALEKAAPKLTKEERELIAERTAEKLVVLAEEVRESGARPETVTRVVEEVGKACVQAASGKKVDQKQVNKTLKVLEKELPRDIGQIVKEEVRATPRRVADEVRMEKVRMEVTEEILGSLERDGIVRDEKQGVVLRKVLMSEVENVLRGSKPEGRRAAGQKTELKERIAEAIGSTREIVGKEAEREILGADQRLAEIKEQAARIVENITIRIGREAGSLGEIKKAELKVSLNERISKQLAETVVGPAGKGENIQRDLVGVIAREVQLPETKVTKIVARQSKGLEKMAKRNQRYFQSIVDGISKGVIIRQKVVGKETAMQGAVADWWEEGLKGEEVESIEGILPTSLKQAIEATGTPAGEVGPYIKHLNVALAKVGATDESIRAVRRDDLENRIERSFLEKKPDVSRGESQAMWQYKKLVGKLYYPEKVKDISIYEAGARLFAEGRGVSPGRADEAWNELRGITGFLRMSPSRLDEFLAKYKQIKRILGAEKLPLEIGECRSLEGLVRLVEEVPQVKQLLHFTQYFTALTGRINTLTRGLLQKVGLEKIGLSVVEKVGGQAMAEFVKHSLTVLAEQGTQKGLMAILNGVLGGGVSAGSAAGAAGGTAAAAGSGGALAGAVAAFQAIPVVGQVILVAALVVAAAVVTYNTVIKPIVGAVKKAINGFLDSLGIDPGSLSVGIKKIVAQDLGLGNFIGGLADFGFKVGATIGAVVVVPLVAIPTMLAGMSMAALGPIIAAVFIGLMVIQQIDLSPKIAGLTPPRGTGGGCISRSGGTSYFSDNINCNQNLSERNVDGVSRETFIGKAKDWRPNGEKNAAACYNDTVCRAYSEGRNPAIVLWAWLHESGASNYEGFAPEEVEDFGIHGQASVPKNDFSKQIDYFLTLDPGGACPGLGNYWLSFATNYLNGSCDPDEKNPATGMTGWDYYNEMRETFSWISTTPLDSISSFVTTPTNEDCGQNEGGEGPGATDEGWCDVGAGGSGGEVIPVAPPDWTPGPVPEGCPDRLPVNGGYYTQGPYAPQCSHQNMSSPAIDIGIAFGSPIYATHPGNARAAADGVYGNYVEVQGLCNGQIFTTKYAHMPEIPSMFCVDSDCKITKVVEVTKNQEIGRVDSTGSSTGNHIHYHVTGLDKNNFCSYLGITSVDTCNQLWGCCGPDNGKYCP